jgi:hypothetical protein
MSEFGIRNVEGAMSYVDPGPGPARAHFKMEGVIVCDHYHDFLRNTLPHNKYLFDKLVVVTSYEDKETQRVCEYNHVECIVSDVMESRKGHFRKGMGINVGLAALDQDGWVVHLDADILLPPQARILLERAELDRRMIFGIDRFIVKGFKAWEKFREEMPLQHECDAYVHLDAFPLGTRVMSAAGGGYVPIGFFQMWNPAVSGVRRYPEGHTSAGREDMLLAKMWARAQRGFIPEVVGYHLESEDAVMSSNWNGRKTAVFSGLAAG